MTHLTEILDTLNELESYARAQEIYFPGTDIFVVHMKHYNQKKNIKISDNTRNVDAGEYALCKTADALGVKVLNRRLAVNQYNKEAIFYNNLEDRW